MSFAGIALIGLRGAGKSTLGKMLAKKIGWSFVELNKEIEAQNGLSVAEIIALYGQEGFRRMEQAALGQLLARKELMVLATGGGIVSEPLTFDLILSSFYTIWLKAEPEEHMARVRRQGDLRPMADDRSAMAELRTILLSREPLYARASAVVDTAGLSVDAAAARLIDAVRRCCASEARMFARDEDRVPDAVRRVGEAPQSRDPHAQHGTPDLKPPEPASTKNALLRAALRPGNTDGPPP
jgi:XRE family aerobic/anaerobic benzoate catabolism transcriptional regulator